MEQLTNKKKQGTDRKNADGSRANVGNPSGKTGSAGAAKGKK